MSDRKTVLTRRGHFCGALARLAVHGKWGQNGYGGAPVHAPPLGPHAGRLCEPHVLTPSGPCKWPLKASLYRNSPSLRGIGGQKCCVARQ